ncbi:TPA: hypothetical protein ACKP7S_000492 [Stenotrophomonas maltophilia]
MKHMDRDWCSGDDSAHNSKPTGKCMARKKSSSAAGAAISTGGGAVAGATSAILGVTSGAAAGTAGAAAVTSGLATVGSVVGGGMLAGLGVVAAAPIAGGAAMFGVYKLYQRMASKK